MKDQAGLIISPSSHASMIPSHAGLFLQYELDNLRTIWRVPSAFWYKIRKHIVWNGGFFDNFKLPSYEWSCPLHHGFHNRRFYGHRVASFSRLLLILCLQTKVFSTHNKIFGLFFQILKSLFSIFFMSERKLILILLIWPKECNLTT